MNTRWHTGLHSTLADTQTCYGPNRIVGYEPNQIVGYEPNQIVGYEPNRIVGYEPNQIVGYEPNQIVGYEPNLCRLLDARLASPLFCRSIPTLPFSRAIGMVTPPPGK
jgi:hypothetical protein